MACLSYAIVVKYQKRILLKRQKLHPEGPEFSKIAAGLWRMDQWGMSPQDTVAWIESALELGISTFDHADIYGLYTNEALFGQALKIDTSLRERMELVSKCDICLVCDERPENRINHYNTTPSHIISSVEQSLKHLKTDYLDLVLLHRPDPLMDADATANAFNTLMKDGKIQHIGVSNFSPSQFDLLQSRLNAPIVTNQVECSLHHITPIFDGTFDQAQEYRASPMFWSPFSGGKLFSGDDEQSRRIHSVLEPMRKKYSASTAQIALAWLMQLPCNGVPIMGTGKTDRLKEAAEATAIQLERQDWFSLLVASQGHPVP